MAKTQIVMQEQTMSSSYLGFIASRSVCLSKIGLLIRFNNHKRNPDHRFGLEGWLATPPFIHAFINSVYGAAMFIIPVQVSHQAGGKVL